MTKIGNQLPSILVGNDSLMLAAPAVFVMLYSGYRSFDDPTGGQSLLKYGMYFSTVAFIGGRLTLPFVK
ncbi:hypothetical protein [Haladaptatus pallidirubidus]|uniref:hypothetical protein n=1 Tax=Haladaptatus pallidirubidus TaxID=1008152 RepID=UPI001D10EA19|nr:hypothetical protein [Haladaptatus pallidirubidus]